MMARAGRLWSAFVVILLLGLVAVPRAQNNSFNPNAMTAQRSYQIQEQLREIDANRAAWVNNFLASWAPYLEGSAYDIYAELGSLAMKAPAWQLYGASLVGDFHTMTQILLGERGAGPYINSIATPQQKIATGPNWSQPSSMGTSIPVPGAAMLGDYDDQLVYTPIPPCRMVDTRYSGARTGIIPANSSRTFDLTTDGYSKGQGGATSGCTGLPSYSYVAWAVNITVTGYSATGGLKAWGYTGTEPNASIINYSATLGPAIANGLTLVGCDGCVDDITVKTFSAASHVIIDVVGYYRNAGVANAGVSRVAGTAFNTSATGFFASGGNCPTGTSLIGGELDHNNTDLAIGESRQNSSNQWIFWMVNNTGGAVTGTAYSRCMDTPVYVY